MKGERVRKAREKLGLTGKELAEILQVSPSSISRWEADEAEPNDDLKEKLSQLLGVTVGYLMGEELLREPVMEIPVYSTSMLAQHQWGSGILPKSREALLVAKADLGKIAVDGKPFAIIAEGDGMTPANVPLGARVIINPCEEVVDGDVALVKYGESYALKWVFWKADGGMEIRSASPLYPPKTLLVKM